MELNAPLVGHSSFVCRAALVVQNLEVNEYSTAYERRMTDKWGVEFQLVPPDMHRRNAAERAIRSFKAHFLAILAGVASDFPRNLWDLLLPQTEMTLNMLWQAAPDPTISAWDFFFGKNSTTVPHPWDS